MAYYFSLRHLSILLRDLIRRYRPGLDIQLAHSVNYFAEHALHTHARVFGVPHTYISAVEIDGGELADLVGEAGGVEVGFNCADGEDKIRGFDTFADAFITAVTFRMMLACGQGWDGWGMGKEKGSVPA